MYYIFGLFCQTRYKRVQQSIQLWGILLTISRKKTRNSVPFITLQKISISFPAIGNVSLFDQQEFRNAVLRGLLNVLVECTISQRPFESVIIEVNIVKGEMKLTDLPTKSKRQRIWQPPPHGHGQAIRTSKTSQIYQVE